MHVPKFWLQVVAYISFNCATRRWLGLHDRRKLKWIRRGHSPHRRLSRQDRQLRMGHDPTLHVHATGIGMFVTLLLNSALWITDLDKINL